MRFAFGIVVGVFLTIGAACVADSLHPTTSLNGKSRADMVNWVAVGDNLRAVSAGAEDLWAHLVGEAKQIEKQTRT